MIDPEILRSLLLIAVVSSFMGCLVMVGPSNATTADETTPDTIETIPRIMNNFTTRDGTLSICGNLLYENKDNDGKRYLPLKFNRMDRNDESLGFRLVGDDMDMTVSFSKSYFLLKTRYDTLTTHLTLGRERYGTIRICIPESKSSHNCNLVTVDLAGLSTEGFGHQQRPNKKVSLIVESFEFKSTNECIFDGCNNWIAYFGSNKPFQKFDM